MIMLETENGNHWAYEIEDRQHTLKDVEKPCHLCEFCPYGAFVEAFPLHPEHKGKDLNKLACEGKLNTGYNCLTFGHDCPVFYLGEGFTE